MDTTKKYQVIYADPAWKYDSQGSPCLPENRPETTRPEYYYPTMELEDMKKLPIKEISEKDCVLFMWATTPMMPEAFELMEAWGFKYKTMITWVKINATQTGYWFKTCTEHLLVGIKGNVKAFRSPVKNYYNWKREKHSVKPKFFYTLIESLNLNPKIELFARDRREGWDTWGNQVPEYEQRLLGDSAQYV